MRKVAIVLAFIVGLAVPSIPLVGGVLTREAHAVLVQNLGAVEISTLGVVRVSDGGFALGWLRSRARTRVEIGPRGNALAFTLLHTIQHGPLPIARITRGPALSVIDTTIEGATEPGGGAAVRGETLVDWNGDVLVDVSSQAVRRADLAWEGGVAQVRVAERGARIAASASAASLAMRRSPGAIVVQSAKLEYTSDRAAGGSASGSVARASFGSAPDPRRIAVEGLAWTSSVRASDPQLLDVTANLRLAALDLQERSYRNGAFEIELRKLDPASIAMLDDLRVRAIDILANGQPASRLPSMLQGVLLARRPMLVASQPVIDLKTAHLETPDGPVDLDLRVQLDPASAAQPMELLQVQGRAALPLALFATLMQDAAAGVAPAAAQAGDILTLRALAEGLAERVLREGFVREESDGRLSTELVYARGQLALNGRPFDLAALLGQASQEQVH